MINNIKIIDLLIKNIEERSFKIQFNEEEFLNKFEDKIGSKKTIEDIVKFISCLRKNDEEWLINTLPLYIENNNKDGWVFLSDNIRKLIKDYYNK